MQVMHHQLGSKLAHRWNLIGQNEIKACEKFDFHTSSQPIRTKLIIKQPHKKCIQLEMSTVATFTIQFIPVILLHKKQGSVWKSIHDLDCKIFKIFFLIFSTC